MAESSGDRTCFDRNGDRELCAKIDILYGLAEKSGDLG